MSDLHLGALNSVLSAVRKDGVSVDRSVPSPALTALAECIRALRSPGHDPPQLVVLGDLFELALTSTDVAAATFGHLAGALRPGAPDAAVAPTIRFVPGNHDHHLWARARDDHYLEYLRSAGGDDRLRGAAHVTHLLPRNDDRPVRDRFTEVLAGRVDTGATVTVEQSYPNLGLVDDPGRRAVVLGHGHFIEPLYRLMSGLDDVFGSGNAGPLEASHLESDNGAWIDFFWSSAGDSGDVSAVVRNLYESLQSVEALEAEIAAVRRAVVRSRRPRLVARLEGLAVARLLRSISEVGMVRERHRPGEVLSRHAEQGLDAYLAGPVAAQLRTEVGVPDRTTFVFGHTHKPFVGDRDIGGLRGPVAVANSGGWVVDTPEPDPVKGGALVIIDEDLNIAVLTCYRQGPGPDSYRITVASGDADAGNPLVDELGAAIDPSRDPWRALSEALQSTVAVRCAQLRERLDAAVGSLEPARRPANAGAGARS